MAGNLTAQVRNIAQVTTAVANGDLSRKITVDVQGEILEMKNTINTLVDQLSSFASEVTRVAREVGTEGILGGQAEVHGVSGTWKDLTDSVNFMAGNLTGTGAQHCRCHDRRRERRSLEKDHGRCERRNPGAEKHHQHHGGPAQFVRLGSNARRARSRHGRKSRRPGRGDGVAGTWKDLTDCVNSMAGNLTAQVRNIADVTTAVANGDLSKKITVDVRGEILELKDTINTMVDQLSSFAAEVTRVAREVGTEGKLGGQADVHGVAGTWKDLTDQREFHGRQPDRPGAQHRRGHDRGRERRSVEKDHGRCEGRNSGAEKHDQHHGGSAQLLRRGSDARGARSGHGRKLGGQADVHGVAGTWKDLTDSA